MSGLRPELPPGVQRVIGDLWHEFSDRQALPAGELGFSLRRTHRFQRNTLETLLELHERYGAVFTVRVLHRPIVAMIGPEANHFMTVTGAENFSWRKGMFGEELTPLIGDGLITSDGPYHDRGRQLVMPAFHRDRMDGAVTAMVQESERALRPLRADMTVDVYRWSREVAMSILLRALLGLDPHEGRVGVQLGELFEHGLSFYDTETWMMLLRGPGTPWSRLRAARVGLEQIIGAEIRRRSDGRPAAGDVLSMLIEAARQEGEARFTSEQVFGQAMNLLFGAHDTTSSTLSFLLYELGRNPSIQARVAEELDRVLGSAPPTTDALLNALPYLSMVVDETLRLYPPVWFGPRLSVAAYSFAGHRIPAGVHVIYSSWVTHRLPELYPDPEAFVPERFSPQARLRLPIGAYVPFGAGQRICVGKRFGLLAVKATLSMLLQRFRVELQSGV